ncbi:MAG: hypothetical protein V1855_01035 [bacterium]
MRKYVVLLSITLLTFLTTALHCKATKSDPIQNNIDAFERQFESRLEKQKNLFDISSFEDSFSNLLKKMREQTKKLDRKIEKMRKQIEQDGFLKIDSMVDGIDDSFKGLSESKTDFNTLVNKADQLAQYKIDIDENDKEVIVSVDLPGFKKEDLSTEVSQSLDKNGNVINKNLAVSCTKEPSDKKEETFQRHFSITKTLGGITQRIAYSISYKNGKIDISIYLPSGMPTDKYTMGFKSEKLVVKFSKEEAQVSRKKLRFKK